ncbi:DUF6504 family protein [Kineococcus indalonis]|uniref:DUF6504 family protein n=1 Tax=Kineococcus indalonis TaxID=2696566 RepID=UPI00196B8545|nr:DUF6504 family protein [Kineococcus indalonis]
MRRFSDEVHVRCGVLGDDPGAPVQFVWRDRLYLVRSVLAHWRERSAWWEGPAVAAVHGEDAGAPGAPGAPRRGEAPGDEVPGSEVLAGAPAPRPVLALGELEREVFRVEAAVGRTRAGVYDLAHPVVAGTAATARPVGRAHGQGLVSEAPGNQEVDGAWRLLRVSD